MDIAMLKELEPLFGSWFVDAMIGEEAGEKLYRLRREENDTLQYAGMKVIQIPSSKEDISAALSSGQFQSVKAFTDAYLASTIAEAELLIRLNGNPNILSVYNHANIRSEDGESCTLLILTELLSPLSEGINAEAADEHAVVRMGIDICHALEGFTAAGVFHGEIKPENIFVDANGNFKLGDFGFGRGYKKVASRGVSGYTAPEVYAGYAATPAADVYSLGILMYKLLNHNRAPFLPEFPQPISFADREIAFEKRMRGELITPPDCENTQLCGAVLRACAYSPTERYSDPSAFRYSLERIAQNKDVVSNETRTPIYIPTAYEPVNPIQQSIPSDMQDTMVIPNDVKKENFTPLARAVQTGRGTTFGSYEREVHFDAEKPTEPASPQQPPEEELFPQEVFADEDVAEKKKINGIALAIIVLLAILIAAGTIWFVKTRLRDTNDETTTSDTTTQQASTLEQVQVANFVNTPYTTVTGNSVYMDNLQITAEYKFDKAEKGLVIAQSISPGSVVDKGSSIVLTVSNGIEQIKLTNVVGKSYTEAYELLTQAGFTVTRKDVENDNKHIQDTVSEMSLEADAEYDKGTAVELSVWGEQHTVITTTEPTTETTTAPTTTQTTTAEPTTTAEYTTDNASDSEGRKYYEILSPTVSYSVDNNTLSSVTIAFNRNIGPNPVPNGPAKIRAYLNGALIQSLNANFICSVDDENGNGLSCSISIDDEDFEFDTDIYEYTVSFPEGVVTSDIGANYGFTARIK